MDGFGNQLSPLKFGHISSKKVWASRISLFLSNDIKNLILRHIPTMASGAIAKGASSIWSNTVHRGLLKRGIMARTGAERVHVRNRFGVRAPLHRHDVTTQVANGYILERASRENGEGEKKGKNSKLSCWVYPVRGGFAPRQTLVKLAFWIFRGWWLLRPSAISLLFSSLVVLRNFTNDELRK